MVQSAYGAILVYVVNLSTMTTRFVDWPSDIDAMAALYDDELNVLLDRLLPASQFVRRQRPTYPWFNKECSDVKHATRRLQRASAAASRRPAAVIAAHDDDSRTATSAAVFQAAAAKAAWYNQWRLYRQLRLKKSSELITRLRQISLTHGSCEKL